MKNKATPTLHDNDQPNAALAGGNSGARQIFKLGLDVDLNNAVTAIQCGAGDIKRGQSFSRARLLGWVRTQVNAGHTVHTVYEACGFGYTLHHELVGAGAHSLVTTPMRHTAQRRRKNDRMDARELCVRLARWLDGLGMNSNRFASPAPKNSNGANLDGSASFSNASYADWRTMDGRCESSSNMRLCPVAGLGHANGNDSRSSAAVLCANNSSPLSRRSAPVALNSLS